MARRERSLNTIMRSIDIAAEFNQLGIEFTPSPSGEELQILCPFHDDTNPSCTVFKEKQSFKCRACQVGGTIFALIAKLTDKSLHYVLGKYDTKDDRPVEVSVIQRDHEKIWTATNLRNELYKRGISDDTIKRYFLGEYNGRITIPIPNHGGMFVNVRKYLPGATSGKPKMTNLSGRSTLRMYPFDQLRYPSIVLCAGEIKALAVAQRLNRYDIGAIALTGGESSWDDSFHTYFIGKKVWVCGDIDEPGTKSANFRCVKLKLVAEWLGNVELPLDLRRFPKGDVNDFIAETNFDIDGKALYALLEATPAWVPKIVAIPYNVLQDGEPTTVAISEAMSPNMVMRRFNSKVVVASLAEQQYYIPKMVRPVCTRDQRNCAICPVFSTPPDSEVQVPPENKVVLAMMETDVKTQAEEIRLGLGVPECEAVTFETINNYKVVEARIQREMLLTETDSDKSMVTAVLIDQLIELNETYEMTGKAMPHPRTQRCVAMISDAVPVIDALSSFKLTNGDELLKFRPDEWSVESIDARLKEYYDELAVNVTKIYERQPMHCIIDLAYHSVIGMIVDGTKRKAWVEVLIVGDSEQGKSEVADKMAEFYSLGEKVDCKSATRAGLLGGSIKIGDKWWIEWGKMPKNNRRLVVLEELKGMSPEVFARLTEMRSSGVAQIPQIASGKAPARTRLVALSNPPTSNMDSYSYGVNAIRSLISNPEDIRRFDICAVINRHEIDASVITQHRKEIPATFTGEQCRRLILWCWTRQSDEVIFANGTLEQANTETNNLCADFTDEVPILGRAGTKVKLLKLAAALAGRTFSTDAEYNQLIVRQCHVEWIAKFLRGEYSKAVHGYLEISARGKRQELLVDEQKVRSHLATLPDQQHVVEHILYTDNMDAQDLCNWCSWSRDEAQLLISVLVRCNAVKRDGSMYKKTTAFSTLLREVLANPVKPPKHIEEEVEQNV